MQYHGIAAREAHALEGYGAPETSVAARLVVYCARLRSRRATINAALVQDGSFAPAAPPDNAAVAAG